MKIFNKIQFPNFSISKFLIGILIVAIVTVGIFSFNKPQTAEATWWNDSWNYRKALTINSDQVAGDLTDFPVLVSLTDTNLSNHAQEDGDDFIFIDSEGKKLIHEIESYVSSTGELVAWVKMPNLDSNTDTDIFMYYGNASVSSSAEPAEVWDENYLVVQHMNDDTSSTIKDSTASGITGTKGAANSPDELGGKIGMAQDLDADTEEIAMDDSSVWDWSPANSSEPRTLETWFYPTSEPASGEGILLLGGVNLGVGNSYAVSYADNTGNALAVVVLNNAAVQIGSLYYTVDLTLNTWYHLVFVLSDSGNCEIWIDGVQQTEGYTSWDDTTTVTPPASQSGIGDVFTGSNLDTGRFDEWRWSDTLRSASWIQTTYNNQNNPSAFFAEQAEEVGPGPVGSWSFDEGYGMTVHDESGQGNDGAILEAVWKDESMCVSGKCLGFDGSNDYIDVPDADSLDATNVTVSAWVKSGMDDGYIIAKNPIQECDPDSSNCADCDLVFIGDPGDDYGGWLSGGTETCGASSSDTEIWAVIVDGGVSNLCDSLLGAGTDDCIFYAGPTATPDYYACPSYERNGDTAVNTGDCSCAVVGGSCNIPIGNIFDLTNEYFTGVSSVDAPYAISTVGGGQFLIKDGVSTYTVTSDTSITDNQWHYISGSYDGTTMSLYVDGVLKNTNTSFSGDLPLTVGSVRIGADYGATPGNFFEGLIDEPKIYPYARTVDQVKQDYSAGLSGVSSKKGVSASFGGKSDSWLSDGLVGYWNMDEDIMNDPNLVALYRMEDGALTIDSVGGNDLTTNDTVTSNTTDYKEGSASGDWERDQGDDMSITDAELNTGFPFKSGESNTNVSGCAWVRFESIDIDDKTLFAKYDSGGGNRSWRFKVEDDDDSARAAIGTAVSPYWEQSPSFGTAFSIDIWYHVCMSINGTTRDYRIRIWDDNAKALLDNDLTGTFVNAPVVDTGPFSLGSHSGSGELHDGEMDEVIIFNDILSVQEMDRIRNATRVVDSSGNGNDGTYYGNASTTGGKFGDGGEFLNSGDYVSAGDIDSYENTSEISVSAWIYGNSGTDNNTMGILGKVDAGLDTFFLQHNAGSEVWFEVTNTDSDVAFAKCASDVDDGSWHHVVGVYDGKNVRVYYDGQEGYQSSLLSGKTYTSDHDFKISDTGGSPWQGGIDEVRVYNRALSKSEVRKLYEWAPGPVLHLKMDEMSGGAAYDTSGLGNNGTIMGASWETVGRFGSAMSFDGSDDYVEKNGSSNLPNTVGSVSYWVYSSEMFRGGNTDALHIVLHTNDLSEAISIYTDPDAVNNVLFLYIEEAGTNIAVVEYADLYLTNNNWHHISGTWNTETDDYHFYIDGIDRTTSTGVSGNFSGINNLRVGGFPTAYFMGKIDDVRIYNYARTQKQILEDMNGGGPAVKSPIFHMSFDEGYGATAHDSSIHKNDGTVTPNGGGTNTTVASMWNKDGKVKGAMEFDGTDDNVDIPANSIISPGDGSWTVSVWANPVDEDQTGTLIYNDSDSFAPDYPQWGLLIDAGTLVGVYQESDDTSIYRVSFSTSDQVDGNWHLYTMTADKNADEVKLYVDGFEIAKETDNSGAWPDIDSSAISTKIGSESDGDTPYDGFIDEVKVWNYALSVDEIAQEYNSGSAVVVREDKSWKENSLVGYWKMDEAIGIWDGTADEVIDASGAGNHGVASGNASTTGGKFGNGGVFDGSSDYVNIPDLAQINNRSELSVCSWVYLDTLGSTNADDGGIFTRSGNGEARSVLLWYNQDDVEDYTYTFNVGDSFEQNNRVNAPTNTAVAQTWQFVCGVMNGASRSIYVDGELLATHNSALQLTIESTADDPRLGGWEYTANYDLAGRIDEVRVYNYALSKSEVRKLYEWAPGPVLELKMDEMSGNTAYDISGNGNDGTLTNGARWETVGKKGSALYFDGVDDYVNLADDQNVYFMTNNQDFTVSAWVYPEDGSAIRQRIVHRTETDAPMVNAWNLGWSGTNDTFVFATMKNDILNDIESSANMDRSTWHYVIALWDDSLNDMRMWVDGEEQFGEYDEIFGGENTGDFNIGTRNTTPSDSDFFEGKIDEVKIWNYARTPAQIAYDYNKGKPIAHYKFDECQGSVIHDESGNGNHGALVLGIQTVTATGTCASSSPDSFWYNGRDGYSGAAGYFDGLINPVSSYIDVGDLGIVNTFSFWMKNTYPVDYILSFNSNEFLLMGPVVEEVPVIVASSTVDEIYVNGEKCEKGYLAVLGQVPYCKDIPLDCNWNNITLVSSAGINASDVELGRTPFAGPGTIYSADKMDEVKFFNYSLTDEQIKNNYNQGAVNFGGNKNEMLDCTAWLGSAPF